MITKCRVLFLCTGNSCRLQMAKAIVNALLGDRWEAASAGTKPAGYVHPKALEALSEIGIQHKGRSKLADEFRGANFDLVVIVCDSAAEECPIWLKKGKRFITVFPIRRKPIIWKFFLKVRDDIAHEIPKILNDFDMETL